MAFVETLQQIVNATEGATGAMIVASDGIPVAEYLTDSDLDIQTMTVEYSALLKEVEKGSQAAQIGVTREVSVITEKAMIMIRRMTEEYFLVLIVRPDGNFGKGRFLLRMSVPALLKEF